ncbi:zinc-binding dehydrogenase [Luteipulveratus sp. YIM 133132]|uniref:zinc-binding dehydrogenase n=1 Tax=Luteipulveratus flavus TaxID=3031728 RepID=UPI0023B1606E|nr:zinc-binding dehydrogenase [Luteipulveratus sp. YIM 133132]MDE9366385.1 zinc-binding dehydrogenase [Luteipulveratus sp. YIM 133132]
MTRTTETAVDSRRPVRTRRNLVVQAPGRVELVEEELPDVPDGGLLLETVATGLSAGTELTFVKGDHPGLHAELDPELGLFVPRPGRPAYPVTRLGYMEVARVAESRTPAYRVGELVASPYGHATAHVSDPVREHVVPLPDDLDPVLGTYVAHLGPICANGLLHAASDVVPEVTSLGQGVAGRRVLVTGGGLIGLLTALFAAELGAGEVAVVEADPRRAAVAEALGFWVLDADDDAALAVKTRWRHGPGDHGADVAFQCRGRPFALATALRAVRPQGAVVDLAFYTDGADEVRLGEEFHHNGLRLLSAQIGRVPRGQSFGWDRRRLSAETLRLLQSRGDDVRRHLVTDVVNLADAPALLADVAAHRRHVVSAVFTVDEPSDG